MAITDEIKRLQLGESLEKIVKNTDSNFVSLFDTVDQLDEAVRGIVEASEAMIFKGTLGTGGTITSLPTKHSAGDTYKVITAGVYAGKNCNVGDLIICIKDSNGDGSNTDTHWTVFESNPDGSVTSSSTSSTDKHIAVFDGSSGRIIKDSGFTTDDLMSDADKTNLNLNTSAIYLPNSIISFFSVTPGSTSTANFLTSGNIKSFNNLPPFAYKELPIRLFPLGAISFNSGINFPSSVNSSSGL